MSETDTATAPSAPAESPASSSGASSAGSPATEVTPAQAVSEMARADVSKHQPPVYKSSVRDPAESRDEWLKKNADKLSKLPIDRPADIRQAEPPILDTQADESTAEKTEADADGKPSPTPQYTPLTDDEKRLLGKFQLPLNAVEERILRFLTPDERAVAIESYRRRDQLASTHMRWLAEQRKAGAGKPAQSVGTSAQAQAAQPPTQPAASAGQSAGANADLDEELEAIDKMLGDDGKPSPLRNVLTRREAQLQSRWEAQQKQREEAIFKKLEDRVTASTQTLVRQLEHDHIEQGFASVKWPDGVDGTKQENQDKVLEVAKTLFQTKINQPNFDFRKTNLKTLMSMAASIAFKEQFESANNQQRAAEAQQRRRGSAQPVGNRPTGGEGPAKTRAEAQDRWLREHGSKLQKAIG